MKIVLDISDDHINTIQCACELMARIGMGQFKEVADFHRITKDIPYEAGVAVEQFCKQMLTPELPPNGYYAIHNDKVPRRSRLAWEAYQAIRHALAWHRLKEEGKDKPDYCGVQYDDPMSCGSLQPIPKVTVEP